MRYLSLVFASLLLVGCTQAEISTSVEDVDIRAQQETEQSEVQTEDDSSDNESYEDDPGEDDSYEDDSSEDEEEFEEEAPEEREEESERNEDVVDNSDKNESDKDESIEDDSNPVDEESDEVVEQPSEEVAEEPAGYTFAEVQVNGNASSCWSVINGNVYDLTTWINRHKGGASIILSLCGTDGSASFNAMHQGQSQPESKLQSFLLGPLT